MALAGVACADSHRLDESPVVGPDLVVTFPTRGANLGGIPEITVAGRASRHVEGSIAVNGVIATRTSEDPARWSAVVPVVPGEPNAVQVRARVQGEFEVVSFVVDNQLPLLRADDLAFDPERERLLVLNGSRLVAVDLHTGRRTRVRLDGNTQLEDARNIVVDSPNDRAFILDREVGLLVLDLAERTLNLLGTAMEPRDYRPALGYDPAGDRVILQPESRNDLELVEVTTGDRTILVAPEETLWNFEGTIVVNPAGSRAVGAAAIYDFVLSAHLSTNEREILFQSPAPESSCSTSWSCDARDVALDDGASQLLTAVEDQSRTIIAAIDMDTGEWTMLATAQRTDHFDPRVAVDVEGRRAAFLTQHDGGVEVHVIDLATGEHALLSENHAAGGPGLHQPWGIAWDPVHERVLVSVQAEGGVLAVEPSSGERELLSDQSSRGSCDGPSTDWPPYFSDIALSSSGEEALLLRYEYCPDYEDLYGWLMRLDFTTDGCESVSTDGVAALGLGAGPAFDPVFLLQPCTLQRLNLETEEISEVLDEVPGCIWYAHATAVAVDETGERAFIVLGNRSGFEDSGAQVVEVDLVTGRGRPLSGEGVGSGPPMMSLQDVAVDAARSRVLVLDRRSVVAVDLGTGNRVELSGVTDRGIAFLNPTGMALDATNHRAFVIDGRLHGMVVVDLQSGDRAIVTH